MIDNLGAALRELKQSAAGGDTAPILSADVLATQFHGLDLNQLVKLTDAPALGVATLLRTPQGATVVRYLVDGIDAARRAALARSLLLDDDAQNGGGLREILEFEAGALRQRMLRDPDNVIYRVNGGQVLVDNALTAELGGRRLPKAVGQSDAAGPFQPRPLVIDDPLAFSGAAGEVLQSIAALHAGNQKVAEALRAITEATATGQAASGSAIAAPLDVMSAAIGQIEARLAGLQRQITTLLRLIDQARPLPVGAVADDAWAEPIHQ